MRRKYVWLAILLWGMLGLVAQAVVITTATGSGADAGVTNDTNGGPTATSGAAGSLAARRYDSVRAKAAYLRFDLSTVKGNKTGATLTLTYTSTAARSVNIYGLVDGSDDLWTESTLNYNTAPGMIGPGATDAYLYMDSYKLLLLGTIPLSGAAGSTVYTTTSTVDTLNLDNLFASDTNNLVTLVVFPTNSDSANSFYFNTKEATDPNTCAKLTFPKAGFLAWNPVPADKSTASPELAQLSWTKTEPNNPSGIITQDIYFGTNEPNVLLPDFGMTKIATGTTASSVTIPSTPLAADTYYWFIDTYDSSADPAVLPYRGPTWTFTIDAAPQIVSQPGNQFKFNTETATFTLTVTSGTTVTYTWYKSTDNVNNTAADDVQVGTNSATLTVPAPLSLTNEGYYYCVASNSGGQVTSNTATLGVKRKVAHWALDAVDGSGNYPDTSTEGHDADPNGTPSFVAGAGVSTGNAAQIIPGGYASAGTWNPSAYTGQMTFSLWAKWDGQTSPATYQGILAKASSFGADTMMWQLEVDIANRVYYKNGANTSISTVALPVGQWVHLAVSFDGTTATLYRDGVLIASAAIPFSNKTDASVNIGATNKAADTGLYSLFFNGALDDIQIYNYARPQTEIVDIYNAISGQNVCTSRPTYDYTGDCKVNLADFVTFAAQWLSCGLYPQCP